MKTTLELPDDLVRALKIRAAVENRRLKDVLAEALRRGLAQAPDREGATPHRVRLPLVQCSRAATPDEEMTPERVAEILEREEAEAVAQPR